MAASTLLELFRQRIVPIIAEHHGIDEPTVHYELVRQMKPQIDTAKDLDRLLVRWLGDDPEPLHSTLLQHPVDDADSELVEKFFRDHSTANSTR